IEEELRRLSHELRPTILDDLGLGPAIEFLADGVSARSGVPITLEAMPEQRLPALVGTVLYRIVQEALNNVSKHAHASTRKIGVQSEGNEIRCAISDDGIGFDISSLEKNKTRGIGLLGIRERLARLSGTLEIKSSSGRGTELLVTIPRERCSRAA